MADTRESLITLMTTPYRDPLAKARRLLEFILEQPEDRRAAAVVDMMRYWMLPDQDIPESEEEAPILPVEMKAAEGKLSGFHHGRQLRRRYQSCCIAFQRDRPALDVASAILRDLRHIGDDIGTLGQVFLLTHIIARHLPYLDMDLPSLVPKLADLERNLAEEQPDLYVEILFAFDRKVQCPGDLPRAVHWLQMRIVDLDLQTQRAAWAFATYISRFRSSPMMMVGIIDLKPPDPSGEQTKGKE